MFHSLYAARRLRRAPHRHVQPRLETLEDRLAPAGYSPTDLGAPAALGFNGFGINNSGQILGSGFVNPSGSDPANLQTFLYNLSSNGPWQLLMNVPSGYNVTYPQGINDSGQILINAENTQTKVFEVFLYNNGSWTNLNVPSGFSQNLPDGINNAGEVFVNTETQSGVTQAYLYKNNQWQALSAPSGFSSTLGLGLNNSGQFLVEASSGSGATVVSHSFLYDNSNWTDIGTNAVGAVDICGDVNDSGQVALETGGLFYTPHVFFVNNGEASDPGAPSGYSGNTILAGFNNTGQILVEDSTGSGSTAVTHPFLYSDGQWTDLNSFMPSGGTVTLNGAGGIDNNGDIVANGDDGHIYLLQPDAAPVVTSDPTSQTVTAGGTVKFTASASGVPTPTGQWQHSMDGGNTWSNFTNPVNGTGSTITDTLTTTDVSATSNGQQFRCVFTNGVGQSATTKAVTLTVQTVPAITSGNSAVFTVGQFGSFTVTATGFPTPTLTAAGVLPSGVTFTDNGNGTATLAGTPAAGAQKTYPFTIKAHNAAGDLPQTFTLTINPAPVPPPSTPPAPPQPTPPPTLNVPSLLALFDGLLGGIETVNGNSTETITDSLFGIPLLVANFDHNGNLVSVTMFGINVTFLFA